MSANRESCHVSSGWVRAAISAVAPVPASCASVPQIGGGNHAQSDVQINEALNRACPVPKNPGTIQDKLRILRGQLVLASIAGYAAGSAT
jgi:hypothetical protein